jgi:hypothetical protein
MISCMWFSWLLLNCEIHPCPSNNSFYYLLMARFGCVSWFYGYHALGYLDFDGFLLLKADDDIGYFIEVALLMLISLFMLVSWFSWLSSKYVTRPFPNNCSITDALMAWDGRVSCFHDCHDLGFLSTFGFSRQINTPSYVLFYLLLQQCHQ